MIFLKTPICSCHFLFKILQWRPTPLRIRFKILNICHEARHGLVPTNLLVFWLTVFQAYSFSLFLKHQDAFCLRVFAQTISASRTPLALAGVAQWIQCQPENSQSKAHTWVTGRSSVAGTEKASTH